MSKKYNTKGVVIAGIGVIITVIGFALFISVFFSFGSFMNDSFNNPLSNSFSNLSRSGFNRGPNIPFTRAVIGALLFGVGGLITRIGVGASVLTNVDQIGDWVGGRLRNIKRSVDDGESSGNQSNYKTCPKCDRSVTTKSTFCNHCGHKFS